MRLFPVMICIQSEFSVAGLLQPLTILYFVFQHDSSDSSVLQVSVGPFALHVYSPAFRDGLYILLQPIQSPSLPFPA